MRLRGISPCYPPQEGGQRPVGFLSLVVMRLPSSLLVAISSVAGGVGGACGLGAWASPLVLSAIRNHLLSGEDKQRPRYQQEDEGCHQIHGYTSQSFCSRALDCYLTLNNDPGLIDEESHGRFIVISAVGQPVKIGAIIGSFDIVGILTAQAVKTEANDEQRQSRRNHGKGLPMHHRKDRRFLKQHQIEGQGQGSRPQVSPEQPVLTGGEPVGQPDIEIFHLFEDQFVGFGQSVLHKVG